MAQVLFLPHYAEVLEQVLASAAREGGADVACRADVDPAVVAGQVARYAEDTGREVRCTTKGDRVAVRPLGRGSTRGRRAG
jgi:hypothetical protein